MRIAAIALLIGFTICCFCFGCNGKKDEEESNVPSKYSARFYSDTRDLLIRYDSLTEAFVRWDSNAVQKNTIHLQDMLENFSGGDRQMDTAMGQSANEKMGLVKNGLKELMGANDLEAKRRKYQVLSNHFYNYLKSINYDGQAVYLQECPMAFNDDETAQWLSNKPQIRNPYLGLYHPKYGKGMLVCGETKDSLNYGGAK